ncbi:MAG TPA: hypothetical protein GXZ79_05095 [Acholeplasma sp.]|nr:hypothetical protein [Acholeplasma sp.]
MKKYTKEDILESIKQVTSMIQKIHAIDTKKLQKAQQTLLKNRLLALQISLELLKEKSKELNK